MLKTLPFFFLLLVADMAFAFIPVPEIFHVCSRNNSNHDDEYYRCFVRSVLALKPHFRKGMPEYNIPSIEPFAMDSLVISDVNTPILSLHVTLTNIKVHGASNFGIRHVSVDFGTSLTTFEFLLPSIRVVGKYELVGRLFSIFPVADYGELTADFSNVSSRCVMVTQIMNAHGTSYVRIRSMLIKSHLGDGRIHMEPALHSQNGIMASLYSAVNQNFQKLAGGVSYDVETQIAKLMRAVTNQILSQFTYYDLFPNVDL